MAAAGVAYRGARGSASRAGVNLDKVLWWGGIAIIGFGVYQLYRAGRAVTGAVNYAAGVPARIGSALGTGLYDLFHPSEGEQLTSYSYIVYFPLENAFHAVNSLDVDTGGGFARSGQLYDLVKLKAPVPAVVNGQARTISMVAKRVEL